MMTTIKLCRNKTAAELLEKSRSNFDNFGSKLSIRNGELLRKSSPKRIEISVPTTVGFVVLGNEKKFLAKSDPRVESNYNLVKDFIMRKIDELRQMSKGGDDDICTLIYGGTDSFSKLPFAQESCRIVDSLEEACLAEGLEPIILSGQYGDEKETPINSYIQENDISLWGSMINKIKTPIANCNKDLIAKLEEIMEYVKIPEQNGIKFEVLGKENNNNFSKPI